MTKKLIQSWAIPTYMEKLAAGLTGTQMRFISTTNWVICVSGTKYNIVFTWINIRLVNQASQSRHADFDNSL